MKRFIVLAILAVLIALTLASERRFGLPIEVLKEIKRRIAERKAQEEADWVIPAAKAAIKYGPTVYKAGRAAYNWHQNRRRDDDEEEADWVVPVAKAAIKYGPTVYKAGRAAYNWHQNRRRDDIESDRWADAAKKAGSWAWNNKGKIAQTGSIAYKAGRDIRNVWKRDEEEADWVVPVAKAAIKYGPTVYKAGRAAYNWHQNRRRDDEEEADWVIPAAKAAIKYGPTVYKAGRAAYNWHQNRRRDDDEEADWIVPVAKAAIKYGPTVYKAGRAAYNWNQNRRRDDEEEADWVVPVAKAAIKYGPTVYKAGRAAYNWNQNRRRDDIESDRWADAAKKAGSWAWNNKGKIAQTGSIAYKAGKDIRNVWKRDEFDF